MSYNNSPHIILYKSSDGNIISDTISRITSPVFTKDDSYIIGSGGNKLGYYNISTGESLQHFINDEKDIGSLDISNDGKFLVGIIPKGFRIWDVQSGRIIRTKIFPDEPNLVDIGLRSIYFTCDDNKLIGQSGKTYYNPDNPNNPLTVGNFVVYDFPTLDSIDSYKNSCGFVLSKTFKYIAYVTGNPNFEVEVYDFNTKELLWKIPVNGPSLTGIEFLPDDKYLVTSNEPSANNIKIWDITKNEKIYEYLKASFMNIDISHDGKFMVSSVGESLKLLYARWTGTSVEEELQIPIIIFPKPYQWNSHCKFWTANTGNYNDKS